MNRHFPAHIRVHRPTSVEKAIFPLQSMKSDGTEPAVGALAFGALFLLFSYGLSPPGSLYFLRPSHRHSKAGGEAGEKKIGSRQRGTRFVPQTLHVALIFLSLSHQPTFPLLLLTYFCIAELDLNRHGRIRVAKCSKNASERVSSVETAKDHLASS